VADNVDLFFVMLLARVPIKMLLTLSVYLYIYTVMITIFKISSGQSKFYISLLRNHQSSGGFRFCCEGGTKKFQGGAENLKEALNLII